MTLDRCGFGRPLDSLTPGDREAVEGFRRFLSVEAAMVAATGEFVSVEHAGEPGIAMVDDQIRRDRGEES